MLKAGLQFIFVILFARNCYLAPFHLDPVVKEALTDLLKAAASHVIFGDADANDLGKRQIQSTSAVRGNYSHSTVIMPLRSDFFEYISEPSTYALPGQHIVLAEFGTNNFSGITSKYNFALSLSVLRLFHLNCSHRTMWANYPKNKLVYVYI